MGGRTLMLCGFLVVLVAVARCGASRSDVRQQLRSEVVYSERNHKEGRYKYGYAVKKGESQFHHQRSLDGAMYGCYGYVDPQGKLFITHYLADMAGYRLVNMANPDRKLAERIRNLGTADSPIDLQHLFPAECQEDGDMKTLKETADAMKASLAESGEQSASYRSRSSSYTVASGSQDSTIRGTSTASQTSQSKFGQQSTSYGSRSVSQMGSSGSGYSKTKGSSDLLKSTSNIEVDQVKSNQNQLGFKESFGNDRKVQASQLGTIFKQQSSFQQGSEGESSVDLIKSNVYRGSNPAKTSVEAMTVSEPKFVMKSNTKDSSVSFAPSDSSRSSTFKNTGEDKKLVGSSAIIKATESGWQDSVKTSLFGSTGISDVKQTVGAQQSTEGKATMKLSAVAEETTKPLQETGKIAEDGRFDAPKKTGGNADSLKMSEGSQFNKVTHTTGSASVINENKVERMVTDTNEGQVKMVTIGESSNLAATKAEGSTTTSHVISEINKNSEKQITADGVKESLGTKVAVKQQTYQATYEEAGTRSADSNSAGTKTTSLNTAGSTIGVTKIKKFAGNDQSKPSEVSNSKKIVDKLESTGTPSSSKFNINETTGKIANEKITEGEQASFESKESDKTSEKLKTSGNKATLNTASVEATIEEQPTNKLSNKDANIGSIVKTEQEESAGVKILDRDFLNAGERTVSEDSIKKVSVDQSRSDLPLKAEKISSGKENVGNLGSSQASEWSTTDSKVRDNTSTNKADATISSQSTRKQATLSTVAKTSEQAMLNLGIMKSTVSKELTPTNEVPLASGSVEQTLSAKEGAESVSSGTTETIKATGWRTSESKFGINASRSKLDGTSSSQSATEQIASGTNVAHETKKSAFLEKVEATSGSKVASQATGQKTSESQTGINVSGNKLVVTTSSTDARTSVGKSEQKASGTNVAHETKKSAFLEKADATSGSKVASQTNTNVHVKLAAAIPDVANYEEINLRFDDDDASDVESGVKQSSTFSTSSDKKTDQETFSARSNSAVYRGTVKYANYATGSNQATDQSKTTTATKSAEVQRKVPRSKARVQQETSSSLEQNVAKNLHDRTTAKNRIGAVTIAEYIKDSTSNDASKMQQTESAQKSTDMSTKQAEISVEASHKTRSEQEYSTTKQNVKVSSDQTNAKDRVMQKESSNVGGLKQGSEQSGTVQTNQMSMSKQEYSANELKIDVSADQSKVKDQIAAKESSSVAELKEDSKQSATVQAQRSSETSSGRSYDQAKAEQLMKQVKESSKDSASIIRFAIPGIIQQGPPVQGRHSFVGIPNLNGIFPTNSQSRVGTVPVTEDDYPRSEVMRLPATPRPSTPASPDAVTVSYQLPSGTDRTPVTPRPTTVFRPTTPGFPATTVKSLIYRTTVGPSGDIYDEIEEEPELGSRPTLMSPQIPEQKPPITTSGGVTVIPSISQGVLVEHTALPHCSDVTLMIPADAKQIFVRTNSPAFRVYGDGDPNERIRLVEPGVYEVNLGATSGIQFNQYRADEGDWKRSNKLQLDMDRSFDYGELVQKPLYSRAQSATTGDGGNQARLNNPYLPLVPAPVEARNAGEGSAEQVLTPEQRSLLSLVPSWKKVLLYY